VTSSVIKANGGQVLGSVRVPINTSDFSSALLQAQASKAKVLGLANAGGDTQNSIKQAAEFGIVRGGQKLAGLLVFINDINSLGLEVAQGMLLTTAFYWDRNEPSRAFAQRYAKRMNRMPNMVQAGIYSATTHYLQAVAAAGTDATEPVMEKMRATPINDFFVQNGKIREDGRMVHDMYLYEVKKPAESKGAWDYYKPVAEIPGEQAFLPLAESKCPLVRKTQ
jgi:branched-chain amino acid transport system substrate-binding protein